MRVIDDRSIEASPPVIGDAGRRTDSAAPRTRGTGDGLWSWFLPGALGPVAAATALLLLNDVDDPRRSPNDSTAVIEGAEVLVTPAPLGDDEGLPPIVLPPPGGDAPRVRPLQTVVLVTAEVPTQFAAPDRFTNEMAAAVDYLIDFAIAGDGAGFAPGPIVRLSTDAPSARLAATEPPLTPGAIMPDLSGIGAALADHPEDDHAIVVVTTQPEHWEQLLPVTPPVDPAVAPRDRPPVQRGYVIDVETGRGSAVADPALPSPETLSADPATRGQLAEAIARAWVAAFGGRWTS